MDILRRVQHRCTRMVKGLQHPSREERLRGLELLSLENNRLRGWTRYLKRSLPASASLRVCEEAVLMWGVERWAVRCEAEASAASGEQDVSTCTIALGDKVQHPLTRCVSALIWFHQLMRFLSSLLMFPEKTECVPCSPEIGNYFLLCVCDVLGWCTTSVHLERGSSFAVPTPAPLLPCA